MRAPGKAIARFGSDRPFIHGGGVVYRTPTGPVLWFTHGQNEVFDTAPVVYVHRIPIYSTRRAFEKAYPDVGGNLASIVGRAHAVKQAIDLHGARRFDSHPIAFEVK